jgi:hypothetical protein
MCQPRKKSRGCIQFETFRVLLSSVDNVSLAAYIAFIVFCFVKVYACTVDPCKEYRRILYFSRSSPCVVHLRTETFYPVRAMRYRVAPRHDSSEQQIVCPCKAQFDKFHLHPGFDGPIER